ncbi:hypothetical protein H257_19495, partial [Aphanomyces astaci]
YKYKRNYKSGAAKEVYLYGCISHQRCPPSLHAVAVNTDVHIRDDMLALTPFSFDEVVYCAK